MTFHWIFASRLQVLKLSAPQTNVIHRVLQMYIFSTKTSMHNEDAIRFCVSFVWICEMSFGLG